MFNKKDYILSKFLTEHQPSFEKVNLNPISIDLKFEEEEEKGGKNNKKRNFEALNLLAKSSSLNEEDEEDYIYNDENNSNSSSSSSCSTISDEEEEKKQQNLKKRKKEENNIIFNIPTSEVIVEERKMNKTKIQRIKRPRNSTISNNIYGEQPSCCIISCEIPVTNRLRFSLRTHKEEDFKKDFLTKNWNKVCHYHYFADLYKYKKITNVSMSTKKTPKNINKLQKKKIIIISLLLSMNIIIIKILLFQT